MHRKGVCGYISVDFTVFNDRFHGMQRMWATDIHVGLTDRAASFVLFNFIMQGSLDAKSGGYTVAGEPRSYLALEYVFHPNLAVMQYGAFFNLCRLKGVSFDLQESTGTVFSIVDSLAGGVLGVMAVGTSADDSVRLMHRSFEFVQEQVGTTSERTEFQEEDGNFADLCLVVRRRWKKIEKKRAVERKRAEDSLAARGTAESGGSGEHKE